MSLVRRLYPFLIFLAAAAYPFWINISPAGPDAVLNLRDFDTPIDIGFDLYVRYFTWNANWGLGIPNAGAFMLLCKNAFFYAFHLLGFTLITIEKVYLTLIFSLLGCGAYCFTTEYFKGSGRCTRASGIAAGLVYMFNVLVYTRLIGVPHILLSAALFPVIMALVVGAFGAGSYGQALRKSLLAALLSVPALSADPSLVPIFVPATIFLLTAFLLMERGSVDLKRALFSGSVLAASVVLLNLWWLTPILMGIFGSKELVADTIAHPHNLEVFNTANNLVHFFDNIRLHWTRQGFSILAPNGMPYYSPKYIANFYNSGLSYFTFIVFLSAGTLVAFLDRANRPRVLAITLLGVIATFFSLGTHAPVVGPIHKFLFLHMPGFQVLRNFFKFQYLMLLWYASLMYFLFGFLLAWASRRKGGTLAVYAGLGLFIWSNALPLFARDLGGRHETFRIPPYYADAKKWLAESEHGIYRVFVLPQGTWEETYDWGSKFELVPMHRNYFRSASLILQEPDEAMRLISPIERMEAGDLRNLFKVMDVRQVLVRKDIFWSTLAPRNKALVEKMPGEFASIGMTKKASFGKLEFYEVPERFRLHHVFGADGLRTVYGDVSALSALTRTDYMSGSPAIALYDEQNIQARRAVTGLVETIVLANRSLDDLAIESAFLNNGAQAIDIPQGGEARFTVQKKGSYLVYADRMRQPISGPMLLDNTAIDDAAIYQSHSKYKRLGEFELGPGTHNISSLLKGEKNGQKSGAARFVVIERKTFESFARSMKTPVDYLFFAEGAKGLETAPTNSNTYRLGEVEFDVTIDGEYGLSAFLKPPVPVKENGFKMAYTILGGSESSTAGWESDCPECAVSKACALEVTPGSGGKVTIRKVFSTNVGEQPYIRAVFSGGKGLDASIRLRVLTGGTERTVKIYSTQAGDEKKELMLDVRKEIEKASGTVSDAVLKEAAIEVSRGGGWNGASFRLENFYFARNVLDASTISEAPERASGLFYYEPDGARAWTDFVDGVPELVSEFYKVSDKRSVDLHSAPVQQFFIKPEIGRKEGANARFLVVLGLDTDNDGREDSSAALIVSGKVEKNGWSVELNALEAAKAKYPGRTQFGLTSIAVSFEGEGAAEKRAVSGRTVTGYAKAEYPSMKPGPFPVNLDGRKIMLKPSPGCAGSRTGCSAGYQGIKLKAGRHRLKFPEGSRQAAVLAEVRHAEKMEKRDGPVVEFRRINPTRYEVKISNARGPLPLVLSESWHPDWTAYAVEGAPSLFKRGKEVPVHFSANGYANGWMIPEDFLKDGRADLVLEFRQQGVFEAALVVSGVSALCCFVAIVFSAKRKRDE